MTKSLLPVVPLSFLLETEVSQNLAFDTLASNPATADKGAIIALPRTFQIPRNARDLTMTEMRDAYFWVATGTGTIREAHYTELDPHRKPAAADLAMQMHIDTDALYEIGAVINPFVSEQHPNISTFDVVVLVLRTGALLCIPQRDYNQRFTYTVLTSPAPTAHAKLAQVQSLNDAAAVATAHARHGKRGWIQDIAPYRIAP